MGAGAEERLMRLALRLARKGLGRTSPNPMVGAVLTQGGEVVGKGYHPRAGEEHAEIRAIRDAGDDTRGATLYVNLEPCNHHGRTGPCAKAIVEAGIRRVVIGMKDPNPLVNGKGIAALRRKGVEVVTGVLEQECRRLNEAFLCYIAEGRPFVTFKSAITLDGRVAARTGDSRWVTGEEARREGHRLRAIHDAIVVGVGTVLIDNPQLTCRGVRGRDPLRVVVDSRLRTPPDAAVVAAAATSRAATLVVTTDRAPRKRERALVERGVEVARVSSDRRVAVPDLLRELRRREVASVLLEGGPTLAGAFWRQGVVDRVVAFVAPKVVADPAALPMVAGGPVEAMAGATGLSDVKVRRVGDDLMISGVPGRR
jgi:diaminohydroxyphosphoribosylaminopyrimidine deaminase/5-amino-6-(5-phosphoribosylamino)uracil reductase